jgi:hypothetical protein
VDVSHFYALAARSPESHTNFIELAHSARGSSGSRGLLPRDGRARNDPSQRVPKRGHLSMEQNGLRAFPAA